MRLRPESLRSRAELLALLSEAPDPFPLDRAALLLAEDEYPKLDRERYERRLDEYAARVHHRAPSESADATARLAAVRRVLYEEAGLHGNREDYYDIRNSYLNEVLDRKLGIPISLATVVLGVAHRLEWPVYGVNFPNHFLVAHPGHPSVAMDPFDGLILGSDELAERWGRWGPGGEPRSPDAMLEPASPRAILLRMLNNIRLVHANERRFRLAALACEKMLRIDPDHPQHERDLGYLLLAAGDTEDAVAHLDAYLEHAPEATDYAEVRARREEAAEEPPPPPI